MDVCFWFLYFYFCTYFGIIALEDIQYLHQHRTMERFSYICLKSNSFFILGMLLGSGDESTVKVAFDAILTHNLDHSSIEDTTIVFDSILTNVGNAYVKDFGAFIAPVPGVYLFTYTIHAGGAGDIFGTLMVNGQRKTSIHVDGSGQNILIASSSRTAILSLNQGDRVYIHILKSSRGILRSTNNGHSAFAGALLFTN